MTVFGLQLIAMVTMFCDHAGSSFMNDAVIMRCIGRFAFIIYALLVAEGYRHFKDDSKRVANHLGGYVVLAVISEFCYDLLEAKPFTVENMIASQNAIITLLLGFLALIAITKWSDKPVYKWFSVLLAALMSFFALANYKFAGVLLICALYYYLEHNLEKSYIKRLLVLLMIFACYIPLYHWARYNFCDLTTYMAKLQGDNTWWYLTHIAIAALVASYKGELGTISPSFKTVYKLFYPTHLFILGVIYQLM